MRRFTKYQVIGPSGVADRPEPYDTRAEAEAEVQAFADRYKEQGFFGTPDGRIPYDVIVSCCEIEEIIVATDEERCQLAREVFQIAYNRTGSFEPDNLGLHLAYLLGAILDDDPGRSSTDWSEGTEAHGIVLALFRQWFPPEHDVWSFIITEREQ